MKVLNLISTISLLASPVFAQFNCQGSLFNNFCCVNGDFSGPVVSSLSSSVSSHLSSLSDGISSRESSQTAAQSSLQASLSSRFSNSGIQTGAAAQITARAVLAGRAITTEVSPGLTCIGDSVQSENGGVVASSAGSTSGGSVASASSTTSSPNAAPAMTQAPFLAMAAAGALAYGAM